MDRLHRRQDRRCSCSGTKLMERRLVMIDKSTNVTAQSSADVPRVGGEDKSRGCDTDFRVGGEDKSRELVDQPRSVSPDAKS